MTRPPTYPRQPLPNFLQQPRPMCGGCKGSGVKHVWNEDALLIPAKPHQPCPSCNGSGWLDGAFDEGAAIRKGEEPAAIKDGEMDPDEGLPTHEDVRGILSDAHLRDEP